MYRDNDPLSCYKGFDLVMFFVIMLTMFIAPIGVLYTINEVGKSIGWW